MNNRTVITNFRKCFVEVMHHESDPNSWIVNRWSGFALFRRRISSNWFIDKQQAIAYADELKRSYEERTMSMR